LHAASRIQATQTLRLVSRTWDAQVLSTPRLWTSISAENHTKDATDRYALLISRSGQLSLDIVLRAPQNDRVNTHDVGHTHRLDFVTAIQPILLAACRWRSLTIHNYAINRMSRLISELVSAMKKRGTVLEVLSVRSSTRTIPVLHRVVMIRLIDSLSDSLNVFRATSRSFVPINIHKATNLRHLDFGSLFCYSISSRNLVGILSSMRLLESLKLGKVKLEMSDFDEDGRPFTVPMLSLRYLQIGAHPEFGTMDLCSVSRLIRSPSLEILALMNLCDWKAFTWSSEDDNPPYPDLKTLCLTWSSDSRIESITVVSQYVKPLYLACPSISHLQFVDNRPNPWIRTMIQGLLMPCGSSDIVHWPNLRMITLGGHHQDLSGAENAFVAAAKWRYHNRNTSNIERLRVERKWERNTSAIAMERLQENGTTVEFYHREDAWSQGDADW
jgi:hypothetical protein